MTLLLLVTSCLLSLSLGLLQLSLLGGASLAAPPLGEVGGGAGLHRMTRPGGRTGEQEEPFASY